MKAMDLIRTLPLKGRVEMDIPMKELTTLRVGGKADCVVFAGSESDVEQIALFCADRDVPLTVVGRGSNLLVRDGGLSGVVLLMGKAFADVRVEKKRVYAQAGATLGAAARAAASPPLPQRSKTAAFCRPPGQRTSSRPSSRARRSGRTGYGVMSTCSASGRRAVSAQTQRRTPEAYSSRSHRTARRRAK